MTHRNENPYKAYEILLSPHLVVNNGEVVKDYILDGNTLATKKFGSIVVDYNHENYCHCDCGFMSDNLCHFGSDELVFDSDKGAYLRCGFCKAVTDQLFADKENNNG